MTNRTLIGLSIGGLLVGGGIGWFGHLLLSEPEVITTERTIEDLEPDLTEEDLAHLCAGTVKVEKKNVLDLQKRVEGLQGSLKEKQDELERIEKDAKKNDAAAKAYAKKKKQEMESEIATIRIQLAAAEQERDALRKELKQTIYKLDNQIRETKKYKAKAKKYKRESVENLWKAFVADSKVQACDRGSRKRHEKCWAAFNEALSTAIRERFMTCVNTYQAVPVLKRAKMFEKLPSFAVWVGPKNKYTKRWYILYCDPSLPTDVESGEEVTTEPTTPREKRTKEDWSTLDLDGEE